MKPEPDSKSEGILFWTLLIIFTVSLLCTTYVLAAGSIHIAKYTFHYEDSRALMLPMCICVFISASILLVKIFEVQKSEASWLDLDNSKVFNTLRGLTDFPLIPGLMIFLFCDKVAVYRIIGLSMMEISYISAIFWNYRSLKKTKEKFYLVLFVLYVVLSCIAAILMIA